MSTLPRRFTGAAAVERLKKREELRLQQLNNNISTVTNNNNSDVSSPPPVPPPRTLLPGSRQLNSHSTPVSFHLCLIRVIVYLNYYFRMFLLMKTLQLLPQTMMFPVFHFHLIGRPLIPKLLWHMRLVSLF